MSFPSYSGGLSTERITHIHVFVLTPEQCGRDGFTIKIVMVPRIGRSPDIDQVRDIKISQKA